MPNRARQFRRFWLAALAAAVGVMLALGAYFFAPGRQLAIDRDADLLLHDAALLILHERTPLMTPPLASILADDNRLRLVTIDEASLHEAQRDTLGQYHFQRDLYAKLIAKLKADGVRTVAFDLQFPADSEDSNGDTKFAAALASLPSVLSYELSAGEAGPISSHLAAASTIGFVPVQNESGTLVSQELFDGPARPSFVVAAVERYLNARLTYIDGWHARLGHDIVPLDGKGRLLLAPFETDATTNMERSLGAPAQWIDFAQSIELVDALELSPSELRTFFDGTLVIVGPTARGVADFIDTPKGRLPAVFSTLRFVDQLLRGVYITRVPLVVDVTAIVGMALLLCLAGVLLPLRPFLVLCICAFLGYTAGAIALFALRLIWLDIIHVEIAMLTTTLMVAFIRSALEGDARRRVTEIFAKHASPEVVHDLLDSELPSSAAQFEGRRVFVTIFYSDIRGFTALAEELAPEAIYHQLNEYFEEMCAIVFKHGGYVDKFIGDALMAVFSAPNPRPDDADCAVLCALDQQTRLVELNRLWAAQNRPTLHVGMGINTGWVVMGQIGSFERVSFTVIGDAVNVAAHLQNHAEGGHIVIAEATEAAVRGRFISEELAPLTVKGKSHAVRTYRVLSSIEQPDLISGDEAIATIRFESDVVPQAARPPEAR